MGGKEKEKTDCELRRVRHAIKATRAGRFLGVSVWVRLTSNPVHVRCHDCPGPWLPLQVEGWLSCRWRCRSSTAAAVCVGKWWIDQYETDEARCLKETVRAHSSPPERRAGRGCFLGGIGSGGSGDSGGGAIKRRFYLPFLMTASSLASR